MKRRIVIAGSFTFIALLLALSLAGLRRWAASRPHLPYSDRFASGLVSEWVPYGGSWTLQNETIVVSAGGSGAKLALRSEDWADYQLWADVELRGHNDNAGVVVRASHVAIGAEAIRGYLVTLRSSDAGLEITRAAVDSLSLEPSHLSGGVRSNTWYQLHVVVVGCRIAVEARNLETGQAANSGFQDDSATCLAKGGIALQTTATTTAWRHIKVTRAVAADLDKIAEHVSMATKPSYPIREREYSQMREAYLAQVPPEEINRPVVLGVFGPIDKVEAADLMDIAGLRSQIWSSGPVRIVGVVTTASPLYVQDATAGVHLDPVPGVVFCPGDEVEVVGRPVLKGSAVHFKPLAGRFFSDRVPVVPLSVTATQAASGRYDGSLIEVNGTVRSSRTLPDGQLGIFLENGTQRFLVRVPYDLFHATSLPLENNSRVRVRGVCSSDNSTAREGGSFLVYATSSSDVSLLEGPPWWSGQRLLWVICASFVLIGGAVVLYGLEERVKFRIVQEERERLSHDMHDTLAQSLAGVGFRLQGIRHSLLKTGVVPQVCLDDLTMTCDLLAQTHREASAHIAALHPASATDGDVLRQLEEVVYSTLDDKDFPVIVSSRGTTRPLSPVVADTLFRVGREAISNALRHAHAQSIRVQLLYRSREVVLSILDDGVGFEFDPSHPGFGIRSMTKRCEAIKARISVTTAPNCGCQVQVTSPYRVRRGLVRWIG